MPSGRAGAPPDFVAVGHLTVDELSGGLRPGGSVLYAGLFAHRQGLRVGLLTSYGPDFPFEVLPPEIEVIGVPAAGTTRFALEYRPEGRRLTLRERAARLEPSHLPAHFAEAGLAYLCPVADEVAPELVGAFPDAAIGVGAQGWCRVWDRSGTVEMRPWPDPEPILTRAQALFLSIDDVAGWETQALALYQDVPLGALTFAEKGAILFVNGSGTPFPPPPRRRWSQRGREMSSPPRSWCATTRPETSSRPRRTPPSRARSRSRLPESRACRRPSAWPSGGGPGSPADHGGVRRARAAPRWPGWRVGPAPPRRDAMGLSDLWWIAFLFIGLQPVIRQKILEASRLRVLQRSSAPDPGHRSGAPPGDDEPARVPDRALHRRERFGGGAARGRADGSELSHRPGRPHARGAGAGGRADRPRAQASPREGHRVRSALRDVGGP